jgi:hypothetical protein
MLIHGESGVGKSRFGGTAPAPRLIIDLEGRARYIPGRKVVWDPKVGGPPDADGSWDICIVVCQDFETLSLVYQWLRSGQHPFVSIIIDSLMEAQKRCIDQVAGLAQLKQEDWGTLLRKLEALVRSYRDLTLVPGNPAAVVLFVVGSVDVEGTRRPLLQGQLRLTVPYYLDVVGYMFMAPQPDGSNLRSLLVQPQPGFVAKDGTGLLPGPIIPLPDGQENLSELYELLHTNGKPEALAQKGVV